MGNLVKYFTVPDDTAKLLGQTEDTPILSDFRALRNLDDAAIERLSFDDPKTAVLARLIKDNPDVSPEEFAASIDATEDITWGMADTVLANVDFRDPARVEQFNENFRKWLRDHDRRVEDQHLTEA